MIQNNPVAGYIEAIKRQNKKRVTRIRWVKWEESLSKIYDILDNQSNIELPNKNTEYFYRYFNDKEDE
jgi:hypothetical protein